MKFRPLAETKYLWIIIVILSFIAIILKSTYRTYVYSNNINDYGIADTSPNFFAGLIIIFFSFTQYQKSKPIKSAFFAIAGLVGYELIQGSIFKNNVFDYKDIIASILGVVMGYLICLKIKSTKILNSIND